MARNMKKMMAAHMGLMMLPAWAMAAPAADPTATKVSPQAVVQELTGMQQQEALLRQQGVLLQQRLRNAQLRQKIATVTGVAKISPTTLGAISSAGPSVLLLTGSDGRYTATIQLPNGQLAPAVIGNLLPGGYRITRITSNGVWTVHDGKREALPFTVVSGGSGVGSYSGQALSAPLPNAAPQQVAGLPSMASIPLASNPMPAPSPPVGQP